VRRIESRFFLDQPIEDGDRAAHLNQHVNIMCRPGPPTLGQTLRDHVAVRHELLSGIDKSHDAILWQWDVLRWGVIPKGSGTNRDLTFS
jgi:hypothetical protein